MRLSVVIIVRRGCVLEVGDGGDMGFSFWENKVGNGGGGMDSERGGLIGMGSVCVGRYVMGYSGRFEGERAGGAETSGEISEA